MEKNFLATGFNKWKKECNVNSTVFATSSFNNMSGKAVCNKFFFESF